MMQEIKINELPDYNTWVARLLGLEQFTKPVRTIAKIDAEYDKDKYAKLLDYRLAHPDCSILDIRQRETFSSDTKFCISIHNKLYLVSPTEYRKLETDMLTKYMSPLISQAKTVIELGCGYGYNLSVLKKVWADKTYIGGEYSQNAIKLGESFGIKVLPFNWYDASWSIFNKLESPVLVFTKQTIEQLPLARKVLPTFRKYNVIGVVHFEPVYEMANGNSLLALLRRAYTHLNDYNTDLLSTLSDMKVNITNKEYDVLSGNPLNVISVITWNPK